jgi:hypothetical protein
VIVVGSKIPSFVELSDNGRLAILDDIRTVDDYTQLLRRAMASSDEELRAKSEQMMSRIPIHYNWLILCRRLQDAIIDSKH